MWVACVLLVVLWCGGTRGCPPGSGACGGGTRGCPPGCEECGVDEMPYYLCGGLEIKVRGDGYMEVDCKGKELNCSAIPQLEKVGKNPTLERIEITACSLPPDAPLACALRAAGASGVRALAVQRAAGGLTERNVAGLDAQVLNVFYDGEYHASEFPARALGALAGARRARFVFGARVRMFANMFAAAPPHLHFLEIGSSGVSGIPDDAFFGLARVTELSLWGNEIANISQHSFRGLSSLEKLILNGNPLASLGRGCLAHSPRLRVLLLERTRLSEIEDGALSGLSEMQEIKITSKVVLKLGAKAFSNLPNLTTLYLPSSKIPSLPPDLFSNSTNLVSLTLANNNITTIPEGVFRDLRKLVDLDVSGNHIGAVSKEMFKNLVSLKTIKLDGNHIQTLPELLFSGLTALQWVHMSRLGLRDIPLTTFVGVEYLAHLDLSHNELPWPRKDSALDSSPMDKLSNLQSLNLSHNNITAMLSDWRFVLPLWNLTSLDLSHNAFTKLSQADVNILVKPHGATVQVDLRHNRIATVARPFWDELPPTNLRILVGNNPFNCDCVLHDFITDIQNGSTKYDVTGAECHGPMMLENVTLLDVPLRVLICPIQESSVEDSCIFRPEYHRTECDINRYIYNISDLPDPKFSGVSNMSLRVRNALSEFRLPEFVRELNLSGLNITSIPKGYYYIPSTVESLDLSRNLIPVVPDFLFRDNLTLYLAGNPIVCECWTAASVAKMIKLQDRIGDFNTVTCESQFLLSRVDPPGLCNVRNSLTAGLTSSLVLLFFCSVLALLYFHRIEIEVYLYSKRWCLSLLPREKIDRGKRHQVFLSFFHGDWKFVKVEILPQIEAKYGLAVQDRDWTFGGNILSLIHQSIEESMRSFLVVTPHYLESEWSMEVFRTLHAQATKDKRLRAVLLLVGVKRKRLDREVRQLLSLATVVEYGERMYWPKIYYALPKDDLLECASETDVCSSDVDKMAPRNGLQVALNDKGQLINAAFVKDIV